METKHTPEYASEIASKIFPDGTTPGYLDHWNRSSQRDFIKGYLKAIEETAIKDLLEAALQIKNEIDTEGLLQHSYDKLLAAIEKATR